MLWWHDIPVPGRLTPFSWRGILPQLALIRRIRRRAQTKHLLEKGVYIHIYCRRRA